MALQDPPDRERQYLGTVEIPSIAASGTFPLSSDFPVGDTETPQYAVHAFLGANAKLEQVIHLGGGIRRHFLTFNALDHTDMLALRDFWEAREGAYEPFHLNPPEGWKE